MKILIDLFWTTGRDAELGTAVEQFIADGVRNSMKLKGKVMQMSGRVKESLHIH